MATIEDAMETLHLNPHDVEEKLDNPHEVTSNVVVSNEKDGDDVMISSEANIEKQGILGEKMKSPKEFLAGDFVWGKVKTYPWWPGQIYDPKDASPFAIKHSKKDHILVAYFGDGSCSWCLPSQLLPFVENFKQISGDNKPSKSLTNAVQCAVSDISRLVERSLTCECVPSDRRDGLARPLVSNAGVKDGVLVPDVDIHRVSIPEFSSYGLLEIVKGYAKVVSADCLLELSVLKSWVSSFYRAKGGGFGLAMYSEPVYIQGLEDKKKTVSAEIGDSSVLNEIEILCGDEYWLSPSPVKISDDKTYHRKKEKSISELMEEDDDLEKVKSLKRAKEVRDDVGKSGSSAKRRKSDASEKEAGSSNGKRSRKRISISRLLEKSNEIKVDVAEKSSDEANEDLETVSSPRERKKSKYLSPPYTNPGWSVRIPGSDKSLTKTEHSMFSGISSDEDLPIIHLKRGGQSQTPESHELSFDASDVDVKVNDLLSEVQFAAVDHLHLSKKGSLETVLAFISALRSSTYSNGVDYKTHQKSRKKRDVSVSVSASAQDKAKSGNDAKTPKSALKKKTEGKKSSNLKKSKNTEGDVSTCLILTVNPGFPIPSKEEILDMFGKFGNLNSEETNVMTETCSVQIVYEKESDAGKAFKSSVAESPFGAENVNYWLQHSKTKQVKNPELSKERDEFMSGVFFIRQKLEMMAGILENHGSNFSAEEKSSLTKEMKDLTKNVEKVSEMVQTSAEK